MRRIILLLFAVGCVACVAPSDDAPWVSPITSLTPDHTPETLPYCRFGWWREEHFEPETSRVDCEHLPFLCGLDVSSDISEPDLDFAIDVVFLGGGFDAGEQELYRNHVSELIDGLRGDPSGIVARDPDLFNFHRVDVIAGDAAGAPDLPLSGCRRPDSLGTASLHLDAEHERVVRAALNAPDFDVVVVILDSHGGRANAGWHINLNLLDDHYVLTHELGHRLFNLGDEYSEVDECLSTTSVVDWTIDWFDQPNLSLDADGTKWADLVSGAVEGGQRYSRCVYHPTHECRMGSDLWGHFCPVCDTHIDTMLRRYREPGWNDGPPRCGVHARMPLLDLPRGGWIDAVGRDANGIASIEVSVGDLRLDVPTYGDTSSLPLTLRTTRVGVVIADELAPGSHELKIQCSDTLGESTTAMVPIHVPL